MRCRVRDRARHASQTTEAREIRLQELRDSRQRKLAAESQEEREAHLEDLRVRQQQRLAAETSEEAEACLEDLRVRQQQRLAAETTEEAEARRERDRQNHRQPAQSPLPTAYSCSVKDEKLPLPIISFAVLKVCEHFPGLTVRTVSPDSGSNTTECLRCSRDKHIPKIYSRDNNMNPGCQPYNLMVRYSYMCNSFVILLLLSYVGFDTSRGDAYLSCDAHHVCLPSPSRAVRIQWSRDQSTPGFCLLC